MASREGWTAARRDRGALARRGSDLQLLHALEPRELIDAEDIVLHEGMLLGEFVEIFKTAKRNVFPVVDRETGRWLGAVYLDEIRPYLFDLTPYPIMTMGEVLQDNLPIVDASGSALTVIQKFEGCGEWSRPLVENGKFIGMLSKSTLFDRYRRELIVHTSE